MTRNRALERLDRLFASAHSVACSPVERFVIFSDLHLGDGSSGDSSEHNASLVSTVLSEYYLKRRFQLVLNGDIEDLYRFPLQDIAARQEPLYRLFDQFRRTTAFYKIVGNHDMDLLKHARFLQRFPLYPALRMQFSEQEVFVLHGHQADMLTARCHRLFSFLNRRIVSPLGLPNGSVAHDDKQKYRTEKRIYDFAKSRRVLSIIGHTHRPLFESLSRVDYLKFQIESLCRTYTGANNGQKRALERKVRAYQRELQNTLEKRTATDPGTSLYDSGRLVPCVFNSGCATGKRGITAMEVANGRISLVFWFDAQRTTKYFNFNGYIPEALLGSSYYRVPLKEDNLDYIFARIKLLS